MSSPTRSLPQPEMPHGFCCSLPEVLNRTDWLDMLRKAVEAGHIIPRIAAEYALEQVADAQRSLLAGGVRGRPVLVL
jgi:NADPH2:quinone reductase